jgi:hypothetical protein
VVGTTTAIELAEAVMWRVATRTALWKDREEKRSIEGVRHTRAGRVKKKRCLPFHKTALKVDPRGMRSVPGGTVSVGWHQENV